MPTFVARIFMALQNNMILGSIFSSMTIMAIYRLAEMEKRNPMLWLGIAAFWCTLGWVFIGGFSVGICGFFGTFATMLFVKVN